jgi:hypothetical protein
MPKRITIIEVARNMGIVGNVDVLTIGTDIIIMVPRRHRWCLLLDTGVQPDRFRRRGLVMIVRIITIAVTATIAAAIITTAIATLTTIAEVTRRASPCIVQHRR